MMHQKIMLLYCCCLCLILGYSFTLNNRIHKRFSVADVSFHTTNLGDISIRAAKDVTALPSLADSSRSVVGKNEDPAIWTMPGYRKPLHWVQKVSHLEDALQFYQSNFNFIVYRHEEFSSGCEATCNGPYGGAWSKTMVGPAAGEGHSFCLELVFNYGVNRYERGNDLRSIGVSRSAFSGDRSLVGTDPSGREFLETPDGHWINLVDDGGMESLLSIGGQDDSIQRISLHVSNLKSSMMFYENILGAKVQMNEDSTSASCSWDDCNTNRVGEQATLSHTCVELTQLPVGLSLEFEASQGRLAIEIEDGAMEQIAQRARISETAGSGRIVHGPIKLEPHGEEVLILRDEDGHEYCFVDARGFKTCVDVAMKQNSVDWDYRKNVHKKAQADYIGSKPFAPSITVVEASTYDDIVADSAEDVLVDLYAPWCILCARNKPVYEAVATRISEISGKSIIFSVYDGSKTPMSLVENDQLAMMMNWAKTQGFPCLFYLKGGEKFAPIEFSGEWTVNGLSSWIQDLSTFPLDLSLMNMEELPEYVFEDEKENTENKNTENIESTGIDQNKPLKKKYKLTLDEGDDCGNCSL